MSSSPPDHPGNNRWQTFEEWHKIKTCSFVQVAKSDSETMKEAFERFGLKEDEEGNGWGDASEAQDAGWGAPKGANSNPAGGW
ncbi:hypothetical protein EDC96DRAFT_451729 [Choanephora cucurbitarum]|nr:hypothetical protein EDC96DRAFT_451729 [Choanephora cucurbitarum]